jgi:hypothetical protein
MKSALFEKRNPLAIKTTVKKNTPNCTNCPRNKLKKKNFGHYRIGKDTNVLFILPSNKYQLLVRMMKKWCIRHDLVPAFIPDVLCSHGHNEKDNEYAILNLHCSSLVQKIAKDDRIKHIFIVGVGAARAYYGESYTKDVAFNKLSGYTMPDLANDTLLSFIYDPSMEALSNSNSRKDYEILEATIFKQHLQKAYDRFGSEIKPEWKAPQQFCYMLDEVDAIVAMKKILNGEYTRFITFDYETTGLKPFAQGHSIASVSIATSPTHSIAFMVTPSIKKLVGKILSSRHIPKVAANNSFEYKWSKHVENGLGCCVNNLIFDCVLGAHLLDLRKGVTGVKFQSRVRYGIHGYDKPMKRFLEPTEEETDKHGANAINTVYKASVRMLLLYDAMDSLVEYWLAVDMMEEMGL